VTTWFSDPRTLAILGGAFAQLVISVWSGRQTAATVADLRRWRDELLVPWQSDVDSSLATLTTLVDTQGKEIERLRNLRERA